MNSHKSSTRFLGLCLVIILILACNLPFKIVPVDTGVQSPTQTQSEAPIPATVQIEQPTASPAPTETPIPPTATFTATPIQHISRPADAPPARISWMKDRDSSISAAQHQPGGGDDFSKNQYERPFSPNTQETYYPDIDIYESSLSHDATWVYVAINLKDTDPQSGTLDGMYAVEIDLNQDGRGDVLVTAEKPGIDWSTDRVKIFKDTNNNVGNNKPLLSDPPQTGDGYETLVFDQGIGADSDAAWARVSTANNNVVWIAFKKTEINNDMQFLWGAWAERMVKNPAWLDYNDHFTFDEAGSPLPGLTQYYPMKALAELDNTCRWSVGFQATGSEPGICYVPPPPTSTPVPPTARPRFIITMFRITIRPVVPEIR
jgi:hypothetical protein